ncbi:hypothetical protein K474DRAFT_1696441, partial [Panus rudis PR-1116 ss-1]
MSLTKSSRNSLAGIEPKTDENDPVHAPLDGGTTDEDGAERSSVQKHVLAVNDARSHSPSRRRADSVGTVSHRRSASGGHRAFTGEKERERKLREDPMVIIHSPQLVECKRCNAKIKLSAKSHYDPCHWQKHRERCIKKANAAAADKRDKRK